MMAVHCRNMQEGKSYVYILYALYMQLPYILESNAHPNVMRTQFLATS
jgi:hypothetical protein